MTPHNPLRLFNQPINQPYATLLLNEVPLTRPCDKRRFISPGLFS